MSRFETIFGIHSVQALLKTAPERAVEFIVLRGRHDQRVQKLLEIAKRHQITIKQEERQQLDKYCEGNHQGVIILAKPGKLYVESDLYKVIDGKTKEQQDPFVLVLDGVTDPHNLGACLRSADAAGVDALVIPKDNSAGLTEVARKVASGAAESVPVIAVTNLARTLNKLKEKGLWVAGAAGESENSLFDTSLTGPRVVVLGAEGTGMRRLTKETCDELIRIPMFGKVSSLNVSVATGIILFEVVRQRSSI